MEKDKRQGVAVGGMCIEEDRILLVRRSQNDTGPGLWEIPKGALEWGEDPIEGLKREFLEETGLKVSVHEPLGVYHFLTEKKDSVYQVIIIAFRVGRDDRSQAIILSDEHDAHGWVPLAKALQLPMRNEQKAMLAETFPSAGKRGSEGR
ncbi:NUDIX hydrolase [Candidatus Woesearchaeota archaeon]|nr:NUDIX hydrolase [Candidatus Woesearchaeota archaeon]